MHHLKIKTQLNKGERVVLRKAIKAQITSLTRIRNGECSSEVRADCEELGVDPSDLYHEIDHDLLVYKDVYENPSYVFVLLQEQHLRMVKHFLTNLKFKKNLIKDKTQIWHKMRVRDYSVKHFNAN